MYLFGKDYVHLCGFQPIYNLDSIIFTICFRKALAPAAICGGDASSYYRVTQHTVQKELHNTNSAQYINLLIYLSN
jgi:hypothetical protein